MFFVFFFPLFFDDDIVFFGDTLSEWSLNYDNDTFDDAAYSYDGYVCVCVCVSARGV